MYTPLPIGIDDFKKLITSKYYYVDKTGFIMELLDKKGEANLFTRPRRFGKTLNMSMLKYYFEIPIDGKSNIDLFQGLQILGAGEQYTKEQEQYPVIMLTLKSAKQPNWEMSYASMSDDIAAEYARHSYVLNADNILYAHKEKFIQIRDRKANQIEYAKSLAFLSRCLELYHHKKTIILIDEYDVPLENAYYGGFYEEMLAFISSLFESALMTNPSLAFSVITGCLRISKESIFTGLNNLRIVSILNENYGEYFGFTEQEVSTFLTFYSRESKMDTVREWYNGYLFGQVKVYNPWSVINYVEQLVSNENAFPVAAWSNTSSNSIVKDLIYHAGEDVKDEISSLMQGDTIEKKVHEDITYGDIYESQDNLWNFLLFTGYLKVVSMRIEDTDRYVNMAIPNKEVMSIYQNQISSWFRDEVKVQDLSVLYTAMLEGKTVVFQQELARQLRKTISYMDSRENFYHGFLLGIFANLKDYLVKSNREAGNGRYDICVRKHDLNVIPVILELKVAARFKELEQEAENALEQIKDKNYDDTLLEEGYTEVFHYGISFYRKQVCIKLKQTILGI